MPMQPLAGRPFPGPDGYRETGNSALFIGRGERRLGNRHPQRICPPQAPGRERRPFRISDKKSQPKRLLRGLAFRQFSY